MLFGISFYLLYYKTPDIIQLSTETFEHSLVTAADFFPYSYFSFTNSVIISSNFRLVLQKYSFIKSLRMSRQDLKDENKETEGSPEVKGKN